MSRERTCSCGQLVRWEASEPLPLARVTCPSCGRQHLFSTYEKMDVALSELCNLRCAMCRRPSEPHQLEAAVVNRVMEEARDIGLSTISFCGGEPFVHPDFMEICTHAIDLGLKVQLVTNGTLVRGHHLDRLTGLDCVTVSIDALPETHDRIRGLKGTFDKAVRALNLAADRGITTGTNTVIQRENAEQILPLYRELLERTGGRLDYVRFVPVEVVPATEQLMPTPEQLPGIEAALRQVSADCDERGIWFSHREQVVDNFRLYWDKHRRHRPLGGCRIPRRFIGYSDKGFYLCWHQGRSIRAPSLVAALETELARAVSREAAEGACLGCNALTYSWDEEWNQGILAAAKQGLSVEVDLDDQATTISGTWETP